MLATIQFQMNLDKNRDATIVDPYKDFNNADAEEHIAVVKNSHLGVFPDHLLLYIFSFLDTKVLLQLKMLLLI
jgi:hypothetical protein